MSLHMSPTSGAVEAMALKGRAQGSAGGRRCSFGSFGPWRSRSKSDRNRPRCPSHLESCFHRTSKVPCQKIMRFLLLWLCFGVAWLKMCWVQRLSLFVRCGYSRVVCVCVWVLFCEQVCAYSPANVTYRQR